MVGQNEHVSGGGVGAALVGSNEGDGEDLLHGVHGIPMVWRVEPIEPRSISKVPSDVVGQAGGRIHDLHLKRRADGVLFEREDHDRRRIDHDGVVEDVVAAEVAGQQADAVVDHAVPLVEVELRRRLLGEFIPVDRPQVRAIRGIGQVGEFDVQRGATRVRREQEIGHRRMGDVHVLGRGVLATKGVSGDQGDGVGAVTGEGKTRGLRGRAADTSEVPVVGGLSRAVVGQGQVEVGAA